MLVYYFVPFIVSNRYLIFLDSNGHNSVTVQNRTHVYMNCFDHKDLGNYVVMSTSHGSPCMLGFIYYKNVACQNDIH